MTQSRPCAVCGVVTDTPRPLVFDRRVMVCPACDAAWRDWVVDQHSGRRDPENRRRRYYPRA